MQLLQQLWPLQLYNYCYTNQYVAAIIVLMGITKFVAVGANMASTCIIGLIAITAIIVIWVVITIVHRRGNNQSHQ